MAMAAMAPALALAPNAEAASAVALALTPTAVTPVPGAAVEPEPQANSRFPAFWMQLAGLRLPMTVCACATTPSTASPPQKTATASATTRCFGGMRGMVSPFARCTDCRLQAWACQHLWYRQEGRVTTAESLFPDSIRESGTGATPRTSAPNDLEDVPIRRNGNMPEAAYCLLRRTSGGTASPVSAARAASSGTTLWPSLPRRRIDTVLSAASFLPTTSSTGILASECSRTL